MEGLLSTWPTLSSFRINRFLSKPWQLFTFLLYPVWHCQALQLYQVCSNWLSTLIYSPRHVHYTALQCSLHPAVYMYMHYTTLQCTHCTVRHFCNLSFLHNCTGEILVDCVVLHSYTPLRHYTFTLHYGTALLHSIMALHSYTTLWHCISLLHSITALHYNNALQHCILKLHYDAVLHSYTTLQHCNHVTMLF